MDWYKLFQNKPDPAQNKNMQEKLNLLACVPKGFHSQVPDDENILINVSFFRYYPNQVWTRLNLYIIPKLFQNWMKVLLYYYNMFTVKRVLKTLKVTYKCRFPVVE